MRKFLLIVGVVGLLAGQAAALDDGPGGYIYWDMMTPGTGGYNSHSLDNQYFDICRVEVDTQWDPTTPVNQPPLGDGRN